MRLVLHVAFFLLLALAIVVLSAFYAEVEDGAALRTVPRRFVRFVGACAAVAAVMLVLEALFVSGD
jgi:hypothetical protein